MSADQTGIPKDVLRAIRKMNPGTPHDFVRVMDLIRQSGVGPRELERKLQAAQANVRNLALLNMVACGALALIVILQLARGDVEASTVAVLSSVLVLLIFHPGGSPQNSLVALLGELGDRHSLPLIAESLAWVDSAMFGQNAVVAIVDREQDALNLASFSQRQKKLLYRSMLRGNAGYTSRILRWIEATRDPEAVPFLERLAKRKLPQSDDAAALAKSLGAGG